MSRGIENNQELNEIEFRLSSEDIKFVGWEGDYKNNPTPKANFAWRCESCGEKNRDSVTIKPNERFWVSWYCKKCEKLMTVWFPPERRSYWVKLHPT